MATLVRRLSKLALFVGLFFLSFRYVRPFREWTTSEATAWWRAADWLEIRDPEDLYIAVWLTIEVIVAAAVYVAIVKLWQHYKSCRSRA